MCKRFVTMFFQRYFFAGSFHFSFQLSLSNYIVHIVIQNVVIEIICYFATIANAMPTNNAQRIPTITCTMKKIKSNNNNIANKIAQPCKSVGIHRECNVICVCVCFLFALLNINRNVECFQNRWCYQLDDEEITSSWCDISVLNKMKHTHTLWANVFECLWATRRERENNFLFSESVHLTYVIFTEIHLNNKTNALHPFWRKRKIVFHTENYDYFH